MDGASLENRIKKVFEKVQAAKVRGNFASEEVTVVAASKFQSTDTIHQAYGFGVKSFGENYVQEALQKKQELCNLDISWHFIGSLQSNKAKSVVGEFDLIHSVDRRPLAEALNKKAMAMNMVQDILIQINIAGEETKAGIGPQQAPELLQQVHKCEFLRIRGLMLMPPLCKDKEESRKYFAQARELKTKWAELLDLSKHPFDQLSMGTSDDYEVAIEEGASIVRLGTTLLGDRPAKA